MRIFEKEATEENDECQVLLRRVKDLLVKARDQMGASGQSFLLALERSDPEFSIVAIAIPRSVSPRESIPGTLATFITHVTAWSTMTHGQRRAISVDVCKALLDRLEAAALIP